MNNMNKQDMLESLDLMRRNIKKIEEQLDMLEVKVLSQVDSLENNNIQGGIINIDYSESNGKSVAVLLRDMYNYIGENKDKYGKSRGAIWDIDLKSVFDDMGISSEWDRCLDTMKRIEVLSKGKKLTVVAKVNGKSKRLHRIDMRRLHMFLKDAFL